MRSTIRCSLTTRWRVVRPAGRKIVLTRSRAYKSIDQAWFEQKNGLRVRRVVGSSWLVSLVAAHVLGELYCSLRLFTNLFQPSCKLKSIERDAGWITRQHHPPRTPLQRLLATAQMSEVQMAQLRQEQQGTDPLMLLEAIRCCQDQLALLAIGEQNPGLGPGASGADRTQASRLPEAFLEDLQGLWCTRQPCCRPPNPRTGKRSRPVPFAPDVVLIEVRLEAVPMLDSRNLMERLVAHKPEPYSDRQMRMLQRCLR